MSPDYLIEVAMDAYAEASGQSVSRPWMEAAFNAVAADIWEQGAESGWQATGEGWNGEYANGTTHDGAQSFRDAGNDTTNPYRASETACQ